MGNVFFLDKGNPFNVMNGRCIWIPVISSAQTTSTHHSVYISSYYTTEIHAMLVLLVLRTS